MLLDLRSLFESSGPAPPAANRLVVNRAARWRRRLVLLGIRVVLLWLH